MKKSVLGLLFVLVLAASGRVPPPSQQGQPTFTAQAQASPRPGDADFPTPAPSQRHTEKVAAVRSGRYDLLLIGDSITQTLGELGGKYEPLRAVWERHFAPRRAINLGFNGYRTEQILWNLQNGELDFAESPKVAIVLIGTNNSDDRHFTKVHTAEEILAGTKAIVELIHTRHPTTKILVLRIFPRGGDAEKGVSPPAFNSSAQCIATCRRAGELTSRLADGKQIFWQDVNYVFVQPAGTINTELMWDLLHPSPAGAEAWAQAIEPTLAQLMGDQPLAVEVPSNTALVPVPKLEQDSYDWYARHADVLRLKDRLNPEVVLIGDSITHFWGGEPQAAQANGPASWQAAFGAYRTLNLGFGWDRIQNVLWRLDHGELDGVHPRVIVLHIGTNNTSDTEHARKNTPAEITEGVRAILRRLRAETSDARIILMAVFPREQKPDHPRRQQIAEINRSLSELGQLPGVTWLDIGPRLLQPDGTISREIMGDFCHPTEAGYRVWGDALAPLLAESPSATVAPTPSEGTREWTLKTRYARLTIDGKGFITSLQSVASKKEYCPPGRPSPLLSLYVHATKESILPVSARFRPAKPEAELTFPNGATALVSVSAKEKYFRFQLLALSGRGEADNAVWGPLQTTVHQKIGDLIGVVRDDDWAVGMVGLDDNTVAGPPVDGDCYGMGYYIHSSDPPKCPVPAQYKEGQWFNIGGDGISDTAFYSHPEEYFQQVFGTGARLEPEFGSSLAYHARDRRKAYTHLFSLLPGFPRSRPRHQESDPLEGVDFIGSGVALYACPDELGLATIESILLAEGLPHIVIDGKWIRDPSAFQPALFWRGPHDQCLEYAAALGFKDVSKDTAEFYPSLDRRWTGTVGFSGGRTVSYSEFAEEAARQGMTHGGLHTLTVFLQGGISHDVTPVPSEHLQAVCHTTLARDISATDTEIVVTEPSFLAEKGTWPQGDDSNYLRIGGEMLRYTGISAAAPWTLQGVKRGHASQPQAHQAGDRLVKLQQNCYNGFVPDLKLLLGYADYYAELMARNRMSSIGFDGLESTVYQNHGYYAVRVFMRRLFETYHQRTGKYPRVTGSNVFAGAWEYMDACNVGGGDNMFNAATGRWGIEGKDIRNGFENSYYPGTFGLQDWHSDWSVYDLENLQAKAIGWEATYGLSVGQEAIDQSGEKEAMLKAFHAWQNARAANVFSRKEKELLRDSEFKFHLEQTGERSFLLRPIRELRVKGEADTTASRFAVRNPYGNQPLELALRVQGPTTGCVLTLPDGSQIKCEEHMDPGHFIVCWGERAFLADKYRRKKADLSVARPAILPPGDSTVAVQLPNANPPARTHFEMTVWASGKSEQIR